MCHGVASDLSKQRYQIVISAVSNIEVKVTYRVQHCPNRTLFCIRTEAETETAHTIGLLYSD